MMKYGYKIAKSCFPATLDDLLKLPSPEKEIQCYPNMKWTYTLHIPVVTATHVIVHVPIEVLKEYVKKTIKYN